MNLTPFSRSHKGLECWKMACLRPISWRNGWILTKLAELYCCDMEKVWLDFSDLDPIFKVTGGLILLENGLSAPNLMKEWMNFYQTHNYIVVTWTLFSRSCKVLAQIYCWDMDWFDFGDHYPLFKVIQGYRMLINGLSAPYCHMCIGYDTEFFISSEKKHLMKG